MVSSSRSTPRFVLATSLCGIGALFALAWWFTQRSEVDASTRDATTRAAEHTRDAELAVRDSLPTDAHAESQRTSQAGAEVSNAPKPSAAENGETLEVAVVTGADRKPVAGADVVYWFAAANEHIACAWWPTESQLDTELAKRGKHVLADDNGHAKIKKPTGDGVVTATSGELWGSVDISRESVAPVKLVLARDRSIHVRVFDAHGAPFAGARVALRSRWGNWFADTVVATSGAEGNATLEHCGESLASTMSGGASWKIALQCVSTEPIEADFDPDHWPKEPIELRARPMGQCEVIVLDPDGSPVKDELTISLVQRGQPNSNRHQISGDANDPRPISINGVTGGRVVFPSVEVGFDLIATARRGWNDAVETVEGRGPTAAGQRATLTIAFLKSILRMHGRVVDSNAAPVADTRFHASLVFADPNNGATSIASNVRTDEEGRFTVEVPTDQQDGQFNALELSVVNAEDGVESSARAPLASSLAPGESELGDLVLAELPVLAEGQVLDAENQPVRLALIRLLQRNEWDDSDAGPRDYWQPMWSLGSRSDEHGHFRLRGKLEGEGFALIASTETASTLPLPIAVGAKNVELHMIATGEIAGEVQFDTSLARSSVWSNIQPSRSGTAPFVQDGRGSFALDDDNRFVARGLLPGIYTYTIGTQNTTLVTVDNLVVTAGETTRDPRLNPVDLKSRASVMRLTIVDPDHRPITQGYVMTCEAGSQERNFNYFQNGLAILTRTSKSLQVQIWAEGFCAASLNNVVADQEIVLRRAPRVRLALARGLHGPDAPAYLQAHFQSADPADFVPFFGMQGGRFDARGECSLESTAIGRIRVELSVGISEKTEDGDSERSASVELDPPLILEIADSSAEQRFELALDQAKIDAAYERLKQQH